MTVPAVAALSLDCLGQRCPLPVIALGRHICDVAIGEIIVVWADDPAAQTDIPAWCRMRNQTYLGTSTRAQGTAYQIKRES